MAISETKLNCLIEPTFLLKTCKKWKYSLNFEVYFIMLKIYCMVHFIYLSVLFSNIINKYRGNYNI